MQYPSHIRIRIGFVCLYVLVLSSLYAGPAVATERQMMYIRWASDFVERIQMVVERADFIINDHSGYWGFHGGIPAFCRFAETNVSDANSLLNEWRKIKHPFPFDSTDAALGRAVKAAIAAAEGTRDYTLVFAKRLDADSLKNPDGQLYTAQHALEDVFGIFEAERNAVYREGLSR